MTRDEFEQQYAERSGITVEQLHELGRWAIQCDCKDELCQGWQMIHIDRGVDVTFNQFGPDIVSLMNNQSVRFEATFDQDGKIIEVSAMPVKSENTKATRITRYTRVEAETLIDKPELSFEEAVFLCEQFCERWPDASYGPAHVILDDYNFYPGMMLWCAKLCMATIMRNSVGLEGEDKDYIEERRGDYEEHSVGELYATYEFLVKLAGKEIGDRDE